MASLNTNPSIPHSTVHSFGKVPTARCSTVSPGPGSYEFDRGERNKSTKFSISKRDFPVNKCGSPGPGSYGAKETLGMSPRFSFREKLPPSNDNKVPGPGAYNSSFKTRETALSYTLGGHSPEAKKTNAARVVPGPGTYESRVSSAPGTKFGSSARMFNKREKVPGPGNYQANSTPTRAKSPSFGFGSGPQRALYINKPTPGPGAYNGKEATTQLSIKMGQRRTNSSGQNNESVGPGSYEFREYRHRKSPSFSLGNTDRMKRFGPHSPGPG